MVFVVVSTMMDWHEIEHDWIFWFQLILSRNHDSAGNSRTPLVRLSIPEVVRVTADVFVSLNLVI